MRASKASLRIDPCSSAAAKYAVMRWHYSKTMPVGKLLKLGAWEDGEFRGVIVFSRGPISAGHRWGLGHDEICELTRVAMGRHKTAITRMVSTIDVPDATRAFIQFCSLTSLSTLPA